jgi:hypothetical protein
VKSIKIKSKTMKIYSIIITIIAVIAIAFVGVFYFQVSKISEQATNYKKDSEHCQSEKKIIEGKVSELNGRLNDFQKNTAVISAVSSSFMIPGDLKVLTVGSQEATEVEQKISAMTNKMERMGIEKDWNDFKSTLKINAVLGLMRNMSQNMERSLSQPSQSGDQMPERQPIQ